MIKNISILAFTIFVFVTNARSEEFVNGYYVKNNNDTIPSVFVVHNLFELHHTINIIDSAGTKTCLGPNDIKAFSFTTQKKINTSIPGKKISHSFDNKLLSVGYVYPRNTLSLDKEIHNSEQAFDSVYNYESCAIDSTLRLFLLVKTGAGGKLHADHYYTKSERFPFHNITIWFMIKDNKIVKYNKNGANYWLLECIADYPGMKRVIQENKIKSFPFDFHFVIDDYNRWSKLPAENKSDTSMTIKGFLDADQYYKTNKYFIISCVTSTPFVLPGIVSAVIISHSPKEKNISIPMNLQNKENADYSKAFKHRAHEKKYRAAGKGAITGTLLSCGLFCCYFVNYILTSGFY